MCPQPLVDFQPVVLGPEGIRELDSTILMGPFQSGYYMIYAF